MGTHERRGEGEVLILNCVKDLRLLSVHSHTFLILIEGILLHVVKKGVIGLNHDKIYEDFPHRQSTQFLKKLRALSMGKVKHGNWY